MKLLLLAANSCDRRLIVRCLPARVIFEDKLLLGIYIKRDFSIVYIKKTLNMDLL